MFEVKADRIRRTIYVRMSGFMREEEMQAFAAAYKGATDEFQGEQHVILADMRGLKALAPEVAQVMMEAIGYARQRGVAMCAHVSDSTISRLQAARVAHQAAPDDDVTIDCVSREEAESQLLSARIRLFGHSRVA